MTLSRDEALEAWCSRQWQQLPRAKRHGMDPLRRSMFGHFELQLADRIVDAVACDNPALLAYAFETEEDASDPWEGTMTEFPHLAALLRGDRGSPDALMRYAGLPDAELECIRMFFEGVSVQGIARAMRRTDGTVRVLLSRAQYRLAGLAEAEGELMAREQHHREAS